ncbi:MAG: ATP-binding protein [Elusimicrobiales bacterium]|nr:ATP-binding protein [Elusimicrobiales bacterium]
MIIKRDIYLNSLLAKKHNGLIKIITGLRRCGKSYLLFKLFYDCLLSQGVPENHIIKVPLDSLENIDLRDKMALYRHVKDRITDSAPYYVFLDEIQLVPEFEETLNSLLHISNADIYVTGSNSRFLVKDVITEFRGRGQEIRVFPLSFEEYYQTRNDGFRNAWADYCTYGGLPLTAAMKSHKEKADYLSALFSKTYFTDIIDRHKIKNKKEFAALTDVLASGIGALSNPLKIEKTFKSREKSSITNKTVSAYIEYLEEAFLISTAQRFDIKGHKYIGASKKYYFTDMGLRNSRLNFRQIEENHIMENVIYNELLIRGYSTDIGILNVQSGGADRHLRQLECDFTASSGSRRIYIQSALSISSPEKLRQEKQSLLKIPDSFQKIIIQKDETVPHYDDDGIYIIGLEDFLLNKVNI